MNIFTKFHKDWTTIVDFLVIAKFWASCKFDYSPSIYFILCFELHILWFWHFVRYGKRPLKDAPAKSTAATLRPRYSRPWGPFWASSTDKKGFIICLPTDPAPSPRYYRLEFLAVGMLSEITGRLMKKFKLYKPKSPRNDTIQMAL